MRKLYLMLIPAIWILTSCSKTASNEQNNAAQQRANDFQASIKTHKFKPVAFYSDKPIHYISTDSARTDLWIYVKSYIKDDVNVFNDNGTVTIYQNADKMPGNEAATINASYGTLVKGTDVMFNFVDYNYVATQYRLEQLDNAYFTVYVDGPAGSKLFSKFARID